MHALYSRLEIPLCIVILVSVLEKHCEDPRDGVAKQFSEAESNLVDVAWVSGAKNPEG